MPTVYNWDPLFNAINGQISNWGQRNQVNSMIDALSGKPAIAPTPETQTGSANIPLPMGGSTTLNASLPALPGAPATQGPLSGINPGVLNMLRNAPPQVSLPLLLKLGTRENEYDTTPRAGINPDTGKPDQFIMGKDGTQKWLGIAPRDKNEFVNGQAVNPYSTPAGTVIPKQEATPDVIQVAKTLYPNDVAKQNAYIQKNSPANLRAITNINSPHWQILTDPKNNTQFRYNLDNGQALTLDGQPYTPSGAQKLGGGASARSPGMAFMNKYITEHPNATSDEISTAAQKFRMGQSEAGTVGTRAGAADVASLEVSAFAKQALDANTNLPRESWEMANSVLQSWDMKTSNPQLRRLMIAADALVNARARAISPTGSPHVNDQLEGRKMLSAAFSSGDFAAAVDQMQMEAEGVLGSTQQSKDAVLHPEAHAATRPPTQSGGGPAKVASDADYAKLPSGAVFIGPDGKQRRKP